MTADKTDQCERMPNEGRETCLTLGVGRDRACGHCRVVGWGHDDMLRWLAVQEEATELQRSHPDWRRGQALFNALRNMDPGLAEQIRATDADPFYVDTQERVQVFARAVMDRVYPPAQTAVGGEA